MAVVYHEIYLPIDTESTFDYIVIKQGDAGTHRVRATLISNNRVYTIPTSGASYFMKFRKPDNNYCLVEATVSDNTISAEVTEEMLRVSGTGRGEFMIVSGSNELKTATFHVKIVKETYTSEDVQSHSDFAPFAALLQGAGAAASNANTAAAAANAAASLAEQKAQAIPDDYSDLVAEVEEVKAGLDALGEKVDEDSSSEILQILSMFYDKLITEGSHGYDYYKFMQQALGIQTKTLKVYVGYGMYKPSGSGLLAYTPGVNTKRMITDPIEINLKLPTTVKVIGLESAGLRFGLKLCIGANLISDVAPVHYPHDGLSGADKLFGYTDKTYTMVDDNDSLYLGLVSGFGMIPKNTPMKKVRFLFADSENMNNDLPVSSFNGMVIVNGEPYTLDFVTTAPTTLKALVYLGKTIDADGDGGMIDNVNRAVSDFLPFYGSGTTISFSGATANNLRYCVRYYYLLNKKLYSAAVGWNDQSALWINDNNQHVAKITLPDGATMIGYCTMIFADKDSDIPIEGITGNIVINNVSYSVEEVQA